jgi:hypothetical protein
VSPVVISTWTGRLSIIIDLRKLIGHHECNARSESEPCSQLREIGLELALGKREHLDLVEAVLPNDCLSAARSSSPIASGTAR